MKKFRMLSLALCAILSLSLAACDNQKQPSSENKTVDSNAASENVQIPSPWTDCDTIEEAAELAVFDFILPDNLPDGFSNPEIQAVEKETIQILYNEGQTKLCLRKGVGTEDISGDFNSYAQTDTVSIDGIQVTMKGSDGKVSLATWSNNGYAYAIGVYGNSGITDSDMSALVSSVQ